MARRGFDDFRARRILGMGAVLLAIAPSACSSAGPGAAAQDETRPPNGVRDDEPTAGDETPPNDDDDETPPKDEPSANSLPSEVLDLTNWKVTLPTGASEKPTEVKQPSLATFSVSPYFQVNAAGDGVQFRAPTDGVTTSGSGYPRSELREMKDGGKSNASWSTSSGTHTMVIDEAITAVPEKKKHVVAGQIHDANDDVIVVRLEYPKLFVDIGGKTGPTLDANYELGKRFKVKFEASDGKVSVYYNGAEDPAFTLGTSTSGCYFKAGAYTQSNCEKEGDACGSSNYGEVEIYDLKVTHE